MLCIFQVNYVLIEVSLILTEILISIFPDEDRLYQKIANIINNTDLLEILHQYGKNKKIV